MATVTPVSVVNNVQQQSGKQGSQKASFKGAENVCPVVLKDTKSQIAEKSTKEKCYDYAKASKNLLLAFNALIYGVCASAILAIGGLEDAKSSSFKDFFKNMNWQKYGALGCAAFSLVMLPVWISTRKSCKKAEEAFFRDNKTN